jgi:transglutaminase-like putative cysteine protease
MDYSILLAAMLRCSGIKCKLVYGYKSDDTIYHSWNEVCLGGKWVIVDPTVDALCYESNISFKYSKSPGGYMQDVVF